MAKKTTTKKPAPKAAAKQPRKIKQGSYKTLKLSKRIKHQGTQLPGVFKLFGLSITINSTPSIPSTKS